MFSSLSMRTYFKTIYMHIYFVKQVPKIIFSFINKFSHEITENNFTNKFELTCFLQLSCPICFPLLNPTLQVGQLPFLDRTCWQPFPALGLGTLALLLERSMTRELEGIEGRENSLLFKIKQKDISSHSILSNFFVTKSTLSTLLLPVGCKAFPYELPCG